ncbi:MAG: UDP-glucose/GDP-mannose dehydrogenase family protein [Bryobacterales bacterium]
MNLSIIGAGHVGLVAGACFAEIGHDVVCIDNDPKKIAELEAGRTPFFEPYLPEMLAANVERGRLRFSLDLADAVEHSEVIFLCVGTPPLPDGEADLSAVERVTRQIAMLSDGYRLIVEKSTVPVLTGERIYNTMRIYRASHGRGEFDVASNPEFLAEGTAVRDFLFPDRIVLGVETDRASQLLQGLYQPIMERSFDWRPNCGAPDEDQRPEMVVTNRNTSEMIKHASNSFLSLKISYANMVARLCDAVGANIDHVTRGMGLDQRIGPQFLRAGIGFGGFCFPKDLQAFVSMAERNGVQFDILREVEKLNLSQLDYFVHKLKRELWVLKGKKIAAWGLAFKANTDDVRFSPAIYVIEKLLAEGVEITAFDPQAIDEARHTGLDIEYAASAEEAAAGADALVLLTEWPDFRNADFARIQQSMVRPLILDGRNLLDPNKLRSMGFEYISMGRP